jgi:cell division septation protein DedD
MANAAPAPTEMQLDSHLSVQVASFHDKDNALRLADVLKRQGFGKVTVGQYDSRNVTWHFVRLGPFRAWEDASRVASELDRSYDLRAYVLPAGVDDDN